MIRYITGDVFKDGNDIIVHGANCCCIMGTGVAAQIKEHYPQACVVDQMTKSGDKDKLGTYSMAICQDKFVPGHNVTIINAYTQHTPQRYPPPFDYVAFEKVLINLRPLFVDSSKSIGMPKIGAGLAGGDWDKIAAIIERIYPEREIKVYIYKG
jgi:O-acetyl-ADP-ribose deacetylase (regulator of RNase III)